VVVEGGGSLSWREDGVWILEDPHRYTDFVDGDFFHRI
jgi:hypothetical protein